MRKVEERDVVLCSLLGRSGMLGGAACGLFVGNVLNARCETNAVCWQFYVIFVPSLSWQETEKGAFCAVFRRWKVNAKKLHWFIVSLMLYVSMSRPH
jgi:hypothetical protein